MELVVPSAGVRTESDGSLSRTDTASDSEDIDHTGVQVEIIIFPSVSKKKKTLQILHKILT